MARPGDRRVTSIATLMLLHQLFVVANESGIPPVTTFLIGGQVLLFLRFLQVPWGDDPAEICLSLDRIWFFKDYKRLVFAAFEHADDFHLYYNMISFMWKGKTLEKLFGSGYFLFMIIVFTALTNFTYLLLNYALAIFLMDDSFYYSCAVGFSGTLFALKVVTTTLLEDNYGSRSMSFASKYGVWIELLYISFITPNTSFVGHLAGILVGFAYVNGPIKIIMDSIWSVVMVIWTAVNAAQQQPNNNQDESERFREQQRRRYEQQQNYQQNDQFRRRQPFGFSF